MSINAYEFPRIYVESESPKGKQVIYELHDGTYVLTSKVIENYKRVFTREVYENSHLKVVDVVGGKVLKSYILYTPKHRSWMLIEKNTPVSLVEIYGKRVRFLVAEGDKVLEDSKIAVIITGKFEIRNVRSPDRGVIVLISECFDVVERYVVVITGEENVRRIDVKTS